MARQAPIDRFWSKVDKSGECWVWLAYRDKDGYGKFWDRKKYMAHRYVYEKTYGEIPEGKQIDHICHNRACVNPEHLRLVTHKQNQENKVGGEFRGTNYHAKSGKWLARLESNGINYSFGAYDAREEAAKAAKLGRLEIFTHSDMEERNAKTEESKYVGNRVTGNGGSIDF